VAKKKAHKSGRSRQHDDSQTPTFVPADPPARNAWLLKLTLLLAIGWLALLGWLAALSV
jgi:hypothetical protein